MKVRGARLQRAYSGAPCLHRLPSACCAFPATMSGTPLGFAWLGTSVACAFIVLLARLAPAGKSFRLSLPEVLAASVPVGIIASAWMVFLTACLTSAIGCVELRRRRPPRL